MKAHILVVDDDPRITGLLRRILAYEGYSVAIAVNGNEALNRALERPPDLMVLDCCRNWMDWKSRSGCVPQVTTYQSSC